MENKKFIADFHIHSHFSLATSKQLVPQFLDYWARLKGITVVGTGDFTHPGWTKELKETLEPAEEGLFKLKETLRADKTLETPFLPGAEVRFILTAEISNIYKKNGKVRKVHNLIFAPDFQTVEKIQQKLTGLKANITSDGRPILGMDSRDLLELSLECSEDIFFVPAHIWTPWFSALGSKSGFDRIGECYGDLAHYIHAVETGLSTDPPMHWMCGFLDQYTLISNSDAHSPEKLGRNATCFNTPLSYPFIIEALKSGREPHFGGTIDLFPQEGKYHYDGHRKCGVCWDPVQTLEHRYKCSVCGKPVTVGVMNRVVQLSDREDLTLRKNRAPFYSIIPLKGLLAQIEGVGPASKKVGQRYLQLVKSGFSELEILLRLSISRIRDIGGPQLAEGIQRMRNREVEVKEGFDGQYGEVGVFSHKEAGYFDGQEGLFQSSRLGWLPERQRRKIINFDLSRYRDLQRLIAESRESGDSRRKNDSPFEKQEVKERDWLLNAEQEAAVRHFEGPALVVAGPGTGKTRVLTVRVAHLVRHREVDPGHILAVTFTNKAAGEIKERLREELGKRALPLVTTFHALGYRILNQVAAEADLPVSPDIRHKFGLMPPQNPETHNGSENTEPRKSPKAVLDGGPGGASPWPAGRPPGGPPEARNESLGFTIIDAQDKARILQTQLGCSAKEVSRLAAGISEAKQQLKREPLDPIFRGYNDFLREHRAFDLDDLIYLPVLLFSQSPELCRFYRELFRWILVDEYQDVNYGQYSLIRQLAPSGVSANLCVIGDPDQAIYGFRGADVQYIKAFREDYPGAAHFFLKKSYRCSNSILQASGHVIRGGEGESRTLEGVGKGVKIKIVKNQTHKSEAEFVARTIEEMMGGLRFFSMDSDITQGNKHGGIESLSDFVVLCRLKSQMEVLEKAFNDHAIPYQVIGETPFFRQEPVKSVIRLLKLTRDPRNLFLGDPLVEKQILPEDPAHWFQSMPDLSAVKSVKEIISRLLDLYFPKEKEVHEDRFKQLLYLARPYEESNGGVDAFLTFAALGTGVDAYQPQLENVALMTLHAAKGLEFKCVFIVGCEDRLLPYALFPGRASDPREERRLLYVGMTRAREFLYLSHAQKRFLSGREFSLDRSPFLDSIEDELIQLSRQPVKPGKKEAPIQRCLF